MTVTVRKCLGFGVPVPRGPPSLSWSDESGHREDGSVDGPLVRGLVPVGGLRVSGVQERPKTSGCVGHTPTKFVSKEVEGLTSLWWTQIFLGGRGVLGTRRPRQSIRRGRRRTPLLIYSGTPQVVQWETL